MMEDHGFTPSVIADVGQLSHSDAPYGPKTASCGAVYGRSTAQWIVLYFTL